MNHEIGNQYSKDNRTDSTGFLAKARLHQSKFRALNLNVPCDNYGNYLMKEDALSGLNFYNDFDIFDEVMKRYPNYSKGLYANMLRSEHIGFNMFIPFKADPVFGKNVFNDLLSKQIQSIDKIEIEYAPSPASKYLNDKTSFDVYIEYTHIDNKKGIIGIEVKYTEHEYKLKPGSKQAIDIHDEKSKYFVVSEQSQLYKAEAMDLLPTDRFRQVWRNQLLGESILIEDKARFNHFTSLTIFPEENRHFIETSKEYMVLLNKNNDSFVPVTYESFLAACKNNAPANRFEKWLEYLDHRYIIED